MPSRFDKETRAKAVRLVKDHVGDYESEWAAIKARPAMRRCLQTRG
jgi:transposase